MKRFLAILTVVIPAIFLSLPSLALAQIESKSVIMPPFPREKSGFLGQNHHYSVVFRGNGEAVVNIKIVFTNTADKELSQISLRIPKVEPKNLSVYQVIREPICSRYDYKNPLPEGSYFCLESREPDFYQYWGESKYQKAKFEFNGDTLQMTFPQSIKPEKSGSFFIYFRAFGYAKKNIFGVYQYNFETLKIEDEIESLQIGIDTDSDLFLKGAKGEVEYRFEESALQGLGVAESGPAKSPAIDRFYQQIGRGRIIKTVKNLASLESYKVKGAYANSYLKLYAKEILIAVSSLFFLIFLGIAIIRFLYKKLAGVKEMAVKEGEERASSGGINILLSLGLSFISALGVAGYTVLIYLIYVLVLRSGFYQFQFILMLFLFLLSLCVYGLLIFGPGIFMGIKKGFGYGFMTILLTLFWLIIFLGIAFLIIFSFSRRPPYDILPALKGEVSPPDEVVANVLSG